MLRFNIPTLNSTVGVQSSLSFLFITLGLLTFGRIITEIVFPLHSSIADPEYVGKCLRLHLLRFQLRFIVYTDVMLNSFEISGRSTRFRVLGPCFPLPCRVPARPG